jgi:SAM-dependent methyltransferase
MFSKKRLKKAAEMVSGRAQDPQAHYQLGELYARQGQWHAAIAEYRTSIALGNGDVQALLSLARVYLAAGQVRLSVSICEKILKGHESGVAKEAREILGNAGKARERPLAAISPNRYQRIKRLADYMTGLYADPDLSVLDVGGGDGLLSMFIPDARYVLAEPDVNGISGTALPFPEKSFTVVVACHVLEHIPQSERPTFLDQLCSHAKRHVLLLNPFFDPDGRARLELIVELTGAQWAKEHLACEMPELEDVERFAAERKYGIKSFPNGSKPTSLAYVFLEHYAGLAKRPGELEKVNKLFNTIFYDKLTETSFPNDYLVELQVGQ